MHLVLNWWPPSDYKGNLKHQLKPKKKYVNSINCRYANMYGIITTSLANYIFLHIIVCKKNGVFGNFHKFNAVIWK